MSKSVLVLAAVMMVLFLSCEKKDNKPAAGEKKSQKSECVLSLIEGKIYLVDADYNNIKELALGDSVTEENILKTDKASTAELLLNNSSFIRIKENTILKVSNLFKNNEIEKTEFKLRCPRYRVHSPMLR